MSSQYIYDTPDDEPVYREQDDLLYQEISSDLEESAAGSPQGGLVLTSQELYSTPGQQLYSTPGQQLYSTPGQQLYSTPGQQLYSTPGQQLYSVPSQSVYSAPAGEGNHYSTLADLASLDSELSPLSAEESSEEISPDSVDDVDDDAKFAANLAISSMAEIQNESTDSRPMAVDWQWKPCMNIARRRLLAQAREDAKQQHPKAGAGIVERMAALWLASHEAEVIALAEELFIRNTGWTQAQLDRHIHRGEPMKVEYLDEEERLQFALTGGPSFTLGSSGRAADTSKMWSKHSGDGWGIFVMDASGTIYVENHKMGLFHHSSFMAGGNVAAAGEVKIANGKLVAFTNKSGHYQPGDEDMVKFAQELADRGIDLGSVAYENMFDKWSGTAADLLRRQRGW